MFCEMKPLAYSNFQKTYLHIFLPHRYKPTLSHECKLKKSLSEISFGILLFYSHYNIFAAIYKKTYQLLKNYWNIFYQMKYNTLWCNLMQEYCLWMANCNTYRFLKRNFIVQIFMKFYKIIVVHLFLIYMKIMKIFHLIFNKV